MTFWRPLLALALLAGCASPASDYTNVQCVSETGTTLVNATLKHYEPCGPDEYCFTDAANHELRLLPGSHLCLFTLGVATPVVQPTFVVQPSVMPEPTATPEPTSSPRRGAR